MGGNIEGNNLISFISSGLRGLIFTFHWKWDQVHYIRGFLPDSAYQIYDKNNLKIFHGETKIEKKVNEEVKEHTEYFTEGDEFSNTKGGTEIKNL